MTEETERPGFGPAWLLHTVGGLTVVALLAVWSSVLVAVLALVAGAGSVVTAGWLRRALGCLVVAAGLGVLWAPMLQAPRWAVVADVYDPDPASGDGGWWGVGIQFVSSEQYHELATSGRWATLVATLGAAMLVAAGALVAGAGHHLPRRSDG